VKIAVRAFSHASVLVCLKDDTKNPFILNKESGANNMVSLEALEYKQIR
jgi:hypothetical protein